MRILIEDGALPRYRGMLEACGQEVLIARDLHLPDTGDQALVSSAIAMQVDLFITADRQMKGRLLEVAFLREFADRGGRTIFLAPSFRRLKDELRRQRLDMELPGLCERVGRIPPGHFTTLDAELRLSRPRVYSHRGP